jgi:hypothetical protein
VGAGSDCDEAAGVVTVGTNAGVGAGRGLLVIGAGGGEISSGAGDSGMEGTVVQVGRMRQAGKAIEATGKTRTALRPTVQIKWRAAAEARRRRNATIDVNRIMTAARRAASRRRGKIAARAAERDWMENVAGMSDPLLSCLLHEIGQAAEFVGL